MRLEQSSSVTVCLKKWMNSIKIEEDDENRLRIPLMWTVAIKKHFTLVIRCFGKLLLSHGLFRRPGQPTWLSAGDLSFPTVAHVLRLLQDLARSEPNDYAPHRETWSHEVFLSPLDFHLLQTCVSLSPLLFKGRHIWPWLAGFLSDWAAFWMVIPRKSSFDLKCHGSLEISGLMTRSHPWLDLHHRGRKASISRLMVVQRRFWFSLNARDPLARWSGKPDALMRVFRCFLRGFWSWVNFTCTFSVFYGTAWEFF